VACLIFLVRAEFQADFSCSRIGDNAGGARFEVAGIFVRTFGDRILGRREFAQPALSPAQLPMKFYP
jgi:hypothetical protein